MINQSHIYNGLIEQVSKELTEIQQIKKNLEEMQEEQKQKLQSSYQSSLIPQTTTTYQAQSQPILQQESSISGSGSNLETQQMQFMKNKIANQPPTQESEQLEQESQMDDNDNEIVEGYIWESMQRNAQKLQDIMAQKGIQDPIQLEQELLKNFKTNPTPGNQNILNKEQQNIQPQQYEEIKYASVETGQIEVLTNQQRSQEKDEKPQDEDNESEFQIDPDFLAKINANMAANDQRQVAQVDVYDDNNIEQVRREVSDEDQQRYAFAMNEFSQSILQGEQESDSPTSQERQQPIRRDSVISTDSVIVQDNAQQYNQQVVQTSQGDHIAVNSGAAPATLSARMNQNEELYRENQIQEQQNNALMAQQNLAGLSSYELAMRSQAAQFNNQNNQFSTMERIVTPSIEPQNLNQNSGSSQRGSVVQPAAESVHVEEQSPLTPATQRKDSHELQNSVIKVGIQDFSPDKMYQKVSLEGEGDPSAGTTKKGAPNEMVIHQELEISQGSYRGAVGTEVEDEISKLINESYQTDDSKDLSVVYKNDKLFDQPKKAIYGIQPAKQKPDF